jgi:hypothetical protein
MRSPGHWDLLLSALAVTPRDDPQLAWRFLVWLGVAIDGPGHAERFAAVVHDLVRRGEVTGPSITESIAASMCCETPKLSGPLAEQPDPWGRSAGQLFALFCRTQGAFTTLHAIAHLYDGRIHCGHCGAATEASFENRPWSKPCAQCRNPFVEPIELLVALGVLSAQRFCPACGLGVDTARYCWRCGGRAAVHAPQVRALPRERAEIEESLYEFDARVIGDAYFQHSFELADCECGQSTFVLRSELARRETDTRPAIRILGTCVACGRETVIANAVSGVEWVGADQERPRCACGNTAFHVGVGFHFDIDGITDLTVVARCTHCAAFRSIAEAVR